MTGLSKVESGRPPGGLTKSYGWGAGPPPSTVPIEACMGWEVEPMGLQLNYVLDGADRRILAFGRVPPAGSEPPPAIANEVWRYFAGKKVVDFGNKWP